MEQNGLPGGCRNNFARAAHARPSSFVETGEGSGETADDEPQSGRGAPEESEDSHGRPSW